MSDAEETVVENVEDTPTEPTIEDKARDRGWRPLEEFEGDEDNWVPAKEFMFRGELMDTISAKTREINSYKGEVDQLKGAFKEFKEHQTKLAEIEIQERIKSLRTKKLEASNLGDDEQVIQLEDEIDELRDQVKKAKDSAEDEPVPVAQNQPHPDVVAWLAQNPWADDRSPTYNPEMANTGMALLQAEVAAQGGQVGDVKGALDKVRGKLQKMYPEELGDRRRVSGSVDTNTPSRKSRGKSLVSRLSDDQRRFGQRFVDTGAYESLEDYAKDLNKTGDLV